MQVVSQLNASNMSKHVDITFNSINYTELSYFSCTQSKFLARQEFFLSFNGSEFYNPRNVSLCVPVVPLFGHEVTNEGIDERARTSITSAEV